MSFGKLYECNRCKFSFSTGWTHHPPRPGLALVCSECGTEFHALGERSPWGAEDGEILTIYRIGERYEWIPSPLALEAHEDLREFEGEIYVVIQFRPEALDCPQCSAVAGIRPDLEEEQSCPRCKRGRVRVTAEVEY